MKSDPVLMPLPSVILSVPRAGEVLRRGAITDGIDSFPLTDVGHLHADRMLRAAFTSRSCVSPHALQLQVLTTRLSGPAGPVRDPQPLQARVVFRSLTM
jgi:hypothetical protein